MTSRSLGVAATSRTTFSRISARKEDRADRRRRAGGKVFDKLAWWCWETWYDDPANKGKDPYSEVKSRP